MRPAIVDRLSDRPGTLLLIVLAVTAAVCAPLLWNGFAFDADALIRVEGRPPESRTLIRELHWPWVYWDHNFHHGITDSAQLFRPATIFSFALSNALFGSWLGEATGHHLFNLLLHLAVTALVWGLLTRFGASAWAAAAGAAVFGLHAIHAEVIAGIISRHELLGCAFGLGGTLLLAVRDGQPAGARLLGAGLLFFLAFSSKESALTFLPFVFFALVALHRQRRLRDTTSPPWRPSFQFAERATAFAVAPAFVAYVLLRLRVLSALDEPVEKFLAINPTYTVDAAERIATVLPVWAYGVYHQFVPYPLSCDYGAHVFPLRESLFDPVTIASAALWLATAVGTLLALRRRPLLALAGATFVGFTFITSNIPFALGALYAERFQYTPSLALALLVGWLVTTWPRVRVLAPAIGLWLLASSVVLIDRIPDWNDSATLWAADLRTQPRSVLLHGMNARRAAEARRYDEAVELLRKAVEIEPRYGTGWADMGSILLAQGQDEAAEAALLRAIDAEWLQRKDRPAALMNLARLERDRGQIAQAAAHLRRAVTELPSFVPAWRQLYELVDATARERGPQTARRLVAGLDPKLAPGPIGDWLRAVQGQ